VSRTTQPDWPFPVSNSTRSAGQEPSEAVDSAPASRPIPEGTPRTSLCRRFDFVWCVGSEFFRDLTATFDQLAPPWATVRIIVDGIEDRSGVGEKCA
jgi:hypothetical protein